LLEITYGVAGVAGLEWEHVIHGEGSARGGAEPWTLAV
jgi:hypothetical protein